MQTEILMHFDNVSAPSVISRRNRVCLGWLTLAALAVGLMPSKVTADTEPLQAMTPPGIAAGPIEGSLAGSQIDSVNLYNGKLSVHLPLLSIGGRGEAGYTMTLPV